MLQKKGNMENFLRDLWSSPLNKFTQKRFKSLHLVVRYFLVLWPYNAQIEKHVYRCSSIVISFVAEKKTRLVTPFNSYLFCTHLPLSCWLTNPMALEMRISRALRRRFRRPWNEKWYQCSNRRLPHVIAAVRLFQLALFIFCPPCSKICPYLSIESNYHLYYGHRYRECGST